MIKVALAAVLAVLLAACTPGDVVTVRDLTINDGARYVQENHDRRLYVRKQLYEIEDEVIRKCVDYARTLEITGSLDGPIDDLQACFDFLKEAYPSLVTVEVLKDGPASINRLTGGAP